MESLELKSIWAAGNCCLPNCTTYVLCCSSKRTCFTIEDDNLFHSNVVRWNVTGKYINKWKNIKTFSNVWPPGDNDWELFISKNWTYIISRKLGIDNDVEIVMGYVKMYDIWWEWNRYILYEMTIIKQKLLEKRKQTRKFRKIALKNWVLLQIIGLHFFNI